MNPNDKLARDPLYGPLAQRYGIEAALDAGFFDDGAHDVSAHDGDLSWWCTPIPGRQPRADAPVVLLTTGAMCPPHQGHVDMLARARDTLIARGHDVVAAYISPGHDAYVLQKCGHSAIAASDRLARCERLARETAWLLVDPWESLHCTVAVNFSDVIVRLAGYLRRWYHANSQVFYVCGEDNARFAGAFVAALPQGVGGCVVVGRPGYQAQGTAAQSAFAGHPAVHFVSGESTASSTQARAPLQPTPREKPRLIVRLEDPRVVRTLGVSWWSDFQLEMCALLQEFAQVTLSQVSDPPHDFQEIHLDPWSRAVHRLSVSRVFALGGYQCLDVRPRPEAPGWDSQIEQIPPGNYVLCDDDRATGATLRAVLARLPPHIVVTGSRYAVDTHAHDDLADCRDFLLGSDFGGLVVHLPCGGVGRVPYMFPHVDPSARCSLRPQDSARFSYAVWSLNARFFAGESLAVRDLPGPSRRAHAWADSSCSLAQLCERYASRIANNHPSVSQALKP